MKPIEIAIIGLGHVGTGVAKLLLEQRERLARHAGRELRLKRAAVRDPGKRRAVTLPPGCLVTDLSEIYRDTDVEIGVELVGGISPAREIVLALLESGKDVVTANKALLAEHGPEIFEKARALGRSVAFEASVGGGIPIVAALAQGLSANEIQSISAILNGTSNFILTEMAETGRSYAEAVFHAQQLGYAEADPTLDVDGTDAAHKLAILAQLAFGTPIRVDQIPRRGIDQLQMADIRYAQELGYAIKLLATARYQEGAVELHVAPALVKHHTPLAEVRGAYNAISVVGDALGDTLYYGLGAGQMPTASAVVADIIDTAVGRAQITFRSLRLWSDGDGSRIRLRTPEEIHSRYYLRFAIEDRPGVLAQIAGVLGKHQVSISSVIQHEAEEGHEGNVVPLVIMTHTGSEAATRASVDEIDRLAVVRPASMWLRVEG